MRKTVIAISLAIAASIASAQTPTQLYNAEEARIRQQLSTGAIGFREAMLETEAAGRTFFPNDRLLQARNESYVRYATQYERGEISFEQLLQLIDQRKQRFDQALAERKTAEDAQEQAAIAEAQRRLDEQRSQNAIGSFLQNMGNSMHRSNPQPINCNSYMLGSQVMTNCR